MPLSRDTVAWAYRILLDREAESEDVLQPKMRAYDTTRELRHDMVTSDEYQDKNRDFAHSNERNLVIKEIEPGLRLWIDLSDHAIGLNILRGRYELNELDFIRRTVRPGQHVVDCGAHIGYFAMHLAKLVGPAGFGLRLRAVRAQRGLPGRGRFWRTRFDSRVRLERAAVGAAPGRCRWSTLRIRSTAAGHFSRAAGRVPGGHATQIVPSWPSTASPAGPVSFIKADIEGAEPLAFRGADELLRTDRPVVLSELHPLQLGRVSGVTPAQFIAEMRGRGYRCHLLGAGVAGDAIEDAPSNGVTSVVFLPMYGLVRQITSHEEHRGCHRR